MMFNCIVHSNLHNSLIILNNILKEAVLEPPLIITIFHPQTLLKTLLYIFLVSLSTSACTKKPDCFTADSIKEMKITSLNKEGYFLFLRTSGFQEIHFYELFKDSPEFDVCGKTLSQPVFQVSLDDSEGFPIKLEISEDGMKTIYSSTQKNDFNLESIDVEIQGSFKKMSN